MKNQTACVYEIKNINTGKKYIGSTKNFKKRISSHFCKLRKNKHSNTYLQNSFNKNGRESFKVRVIHECKLAERQKLEQEVFDIYLETDSWDCLYNIAKDAEAPMKGMEFSEEVLQKKSEVMTEMWKNPEYREKIIRIQKKRCNTKEYKKEFSKRSKEFWKDPETKLKQSKSQKERFKNEDHPTLGRKDTFEQRIQKSKSSASLTRGEVEEIRFIYRTEKFTQSELAEKYGISTSSIHNIIKRKTYKWVA